MSLRALFELPDCFFYARVLGDIPFLLIERCFFERLTNTRAHLVVAPSFVLMSPLLLGAAALIALSNFNTI